MEKLFDEIGVVLAISLFENNGELFSRRAAKRRSEIYLQLRTAKCSASMAPERLNVLLLDTIHFRLRVWLNLVHHFLRH